MRLFSASLALLLWAAVSSAATFIVTKETDDDGPCTPDDCALREAVQAANDLPGADVIEIPGGTYLLSLVGPVPENFNQTGDLDIRDDVEIRGDLLEEVTIIGDGVDRVIDITNRSSAEISHLTITGGVGGDGGGIRATGRNFVMRDSIVTGNTTLNGSGGGVILGIDTSRIERSAIYGNSTSNGRGGGVFASTSDLFDRFELVNSTVSGNDARVGGGLYLFGSGFIDIRNSTIADNVAEVLFSSGLIGDMSTRLSLFNNLIVNNDCGYFGAIPMPNGHNLESPTSTCFVPGYGDQAGVPDALLAPLADYGGPTPTHALLPGSPAIDAALDVDCPAVDQRGVIRPLDGDLDGTAICDVGAYEALAVLPATVEIPVLSEIGLLLLTLGLGLAGLGLLRRLAPSS